MSPPSLHRFTSCWRVIRYVLCCASSPTPHPHTQQVLTTIFIVLNIARVENMQTTKDDFPRSNNIYSTLLTRMADWNKIKWAERNHAFPNDDCSTTNTATITELTPDKKELRMQRPPQASCFSSRPDLRNTRRGLLHIVLIASTVCKFNIRDDTLYNTCNQLCTEMFLTYPGEVLGNLCCGYKGPIYVSKYLRFLMMSTGPLCTPPDPDSFLPGKVTSPVSFSDKNEAVPHAIQDAWLPLFTALLNLAHSKNPRTGQTICAAFTEAIRQQVTKLQMNEELIRDNEAKLRNHRQQQKKKQEKGERREKTATWWVTLLPGFAHSEKTQETSEEREQKVANWVRDVKLKVEEAKEQAENLRRPLPGLLSLVRVLLCRVHSYGEDAPRAWGELMAAISPLQVFPGRAGVLATDIYRATASAVQCMDSLLRFRLGRTFVYGGDMSTFKRERAYLLVNPLAARSKVLYKVFLGHVPLAGFPYAAHPKSGAASQASQASRPGANGSFAVSLASISTGSSGHNALFGGATPGIHNNAMVEDLIRMNWTDDVLAASSLVLNTFLKIAECEAAKPRKERRVHENMHDTLAQTPPSVLAQYFPELHRLMAGPVGGVGRMMPFSEGAGQKLHVVESLYASLIALYRTVVKDSAHKVHDRMLDYHVPSPRNPYLDIALRMLPTDAEGSDGAEDSRLGGVHVCKSNENIKRHAVTWGNLLLNLIDDQTNYYRNTPDYWGEVSKHLNPYEVKVVIGGGSGTIHRFANGLAKLSSTGKLPRYPLFRVYPLPLGRENLLCNWMQKQDSMYHQLISWPLQQADGDKDLGRVSAGDLEALLTENGPTYPDTTESFSLRTALDTYLADTDKASKVYIYKCECWGTPKPAGGPAPAPTGLGGGGGGFGAASSAFGGDSEGRTHRAASEKNLFTPSSDLMLGEDGLPKSVAASGASGSGSGSGGGGDIPNGSGTVPAYPLLYTPPSILSQNSGHGSATDTVDLGGPPGAGAASAVPASGPAAGAEEKEAAAAAAEKKAAADAAAAAPVAAEQPSGTGVPGEGAPTLTFAWCQQLEFGPASEAARVLKLKRAAKSGKKAGSAGAGASPRNGIHSSISHGDLHLYAQDDASGGGSGSHSPFSQQGLLSEEVYAHGSGSSLASPSGMTEPQSSRAQSPGGSARSKRAGSLMASVNRNRSGSSNTLQDKGSARLPMLDLPSPTASTAAGAGAATGTDTVLNVNHKCCGVTLRRMHEALSDSGVFDMRLDTDRTVKVGTGSSILGWLLEGAFRHECRDEASATRSAQVLLDNNVIVLAQPMAPSPTNLDSPPTPKHDRGNGEAERSPSPDSPRNADKVFRAEANYKLGLLPQQRANIVTRKLTMVTDPPAHVEIQHIPFSGGQDYPDLRQGKDVWIHKISLRNVGKEGDAGLYPDPTQPALQMYVLGNRKPDKIGAGGKTFQGGEGQNYTVLGQLTVTAKGAQDAFHVVADGNLYGPFHKIQVSPWLDLDKVEVVKRHLSFDVMGFTPLGGAS